MFQNFRASDQELGPVFDCWERSSAWVGVLGFIVRLQLSDIERSKLEWPASSTSGLRVSWSAIGIIHWFRDSQ